jgi:hypothetical protein
MEGRGFKIMSAFDPLYAKLPLWAQHIAVSAYGVYWRQLRFGAGYAQFVREYQQREFLFQT